MATIAYCPDADIAQFDQFADVNGCGFGLVHDCPVSYCKMGVVNPQGVIVPATVEKVFVFIYPPMLVPAIEKFVVMSPIKSP